MNKKTEKKYQAKTGSNDQNITVKKRGRPKGSKNKLPAKTRKDNIQAVLSDETRERINNFNFALFQLPKVDRNDENMILERINQYFSMCNAFSVSPTIASFAAALRIDRTTLWSWINNKQGEIKNAKVIDTLKDVYTIINSQYEMMLTEGKIIPVSAFFLMQNNYGYKQQSDHVLITNQEKEENTQDIVARAGLLND